MGNKTSFKKLALMLSLGSLTGGITIAAIAGLFTVNNFPELAIGFFMGPGAFITSIFLDGSIKQRILTAFLAGTLATILAIFAAGFGPVLLSKINIDILKVTGGIAVLVIGLIITGIKIPDKLPLIIILIGIIGAVIWK